MTLVRLAACLLLLACRPPGYDGGDDDDDTPAVDASVTEPDGSVDAPPAATCDQAFRLEGRSNAASVWLTGSFVAWGGDPANGAVPMALGGDGAWTVTHTFEAGSHQYKFIVNGTEWIVDPANPSQVDDGFGGKNSLYLCAP